MPEITAVETFLLFEVQGQSKDTFKVASFSGNEGISRLFSYSLDLASADHDLDPQSVLGKSAHLTIKGTDADRHVHGMVSRIEQAGRADEFSRYRLTVVPAVWKLGLRQNSRIFQEKSVPDIIKKVLKDAAIPDDQVELKVHGDHKPWIYCVQYRETDLAFISRLMEQEGIFYFCKHDEKSAVMRIGDDTSDHPAAPDVGRLPLRPGSGMAMAEETVTRFTVAEEVRPDAAAVRDYNFTKPTVDLTGTAKDRPGLSTEVYDYPGEYDEPDEGRALAKIRLEELRATRRRGSGDSTCPRLTPGHTFELEGHGRGDLNRKYLLLDVQHNGTQPQVLKREGLGASSSYGCSFACIPSDIPFRPPRITPRPMAQGAQTAIVVGPSGEEIHTDEHGRIKVQFHWDREGKKDENSSCWMRVAQAWAGAKWGGLFVPRIGQEVIVTFLDGDPDQPIVTGTVYNADNPPPYDLPGSKTKSSLKTNSSKGGGGSNELRFEDAKGGEEIFLHGQKDWNVQIENDHSSHIGANRTVQVGGHHDESIGKNMSLNVASNLTEMVGVNHSETVGAAMELTVGGALALTVGAALVESVGAAKATNVGASKSETIGKTASLQVGDDLGETVGKDRNVQIGKDLKEKIGGQHQEQVEKEFVLQAKKIQLTAQDEIAITSGSAEVILKKSGDISIKGKKISIEGSGDVIVKGSKIKEN